MFRHIKHIHFVGIGGTGMSGIAELLLHYGYKITGSDINPSDITERLKGLGAEVFCSHSPSNISGADVVVYSSAVKGSNVEIVHAQRLKIPVVRRAEMLAELMRLRDGIAVAGTHGKTTTTSMIGRLLKEADLDPTIIVGGIVRSFGASSHLGNGKFLVCEADEFDRSFLKLTPTLAVVTNIEAEHLDCYPNIDEIKNAFCEFCNKVPFYGAVILCGDDPGARSIQHLIKKKVITYGLEPDCLIKGEEIKFRGMHTEFTIRHKNETHKIDLKIPGIHNVKNGLAAVSIGIELEIDFQTIKAAIESFEGVRRRFELVGKISGNTIFDDYAHHPTEIEATLSAAKNIPHSKIIAVFQPHLYTRTQNFYREFASSFKDADALIVSAIYPAREEPISGVTGELISEEAKKLWPQKEIHYVEELEKIPDFVRRLAQDGSLVITMGAGDVWKVGDMLLKR